MQAAAAGAVASVLRSLTTVASSGKTILDSLTRSAESTGSALLKVAGHLADIALKPTGMTTGDVGAAILNAAGIPRISIKPPTTAPGTGAVAGGMSEEQTAAIKAMRDQIQGYEWLRQNRKMAASEELALLLTMEKQALVVQDELVAARELEMIRGRIAAMRPAELAEAKRTAQESIDTFTVPPPAVIPSKPFEPVFDSRFLMSTEEAKRVIEEWTREVEKLTVAQEREMAVMAESRAALESGIHSFFSDVITGTKTIGEAFGQMVKWIVEQVFIATATKAVLSAIGLKEGGTVMAMAGGGTMAVPPPFIPAQHGLILSGTRGRDTVPVAAQRGEMFVSRQDTDDLRRFLRDQDRSGGGSSDAKPSVTNNYSFPVTVQTVVADEKTIRQAWEEQIGPVAMRSIERGSMRTW